MRLMGSAVVWRSGNWVIEYLEWGLVHGWKQVLELSLALFSKGG